MTDFLGVYSDYLTESGLRVFERAFEESSRRQQKGVSYGHILKALKTEEPALFNKTLANLKAAAPLTDEYLDIIIERSSDYSSKEGQLSPRIADVCRTAMDVARADNRRKIEAADLVIAIECLVLADAPWLSERH